mmetsp:Transcript_9252/g.24440  ORF Transcript_9252/g.24440 Transcript_9252/m.24440 type:complete len:222 (+) Transcript_9252:370-1035(+)
MDEKKLSLGKLIEEALETVDLSELEHVRSFLELGNDRAESAPSRTPLLTDWKDGDAGRETRSLDDSQTGADGGKVARLRETAKKKRSSKVAGFVAKESSRAVQVQSAGELAAGAGKRADYCHGCARNIYGAAPGARVPEANKKPRFAFLVCAGITGRRCHKIFCDKCCQRGEWNFEELVSQSCWTCPHCRRTPCPPNMRCHRYSVARQRQRSMSSHSSERD